MDDFIVRALLAGVGLALVAGPAGCFIVWRRLSYFGETIAHSTLLGVALAVFLNINLAVGVFATASVVALGMFYLERRDTLPSDTILGLLAHGSLALGFVVLAFLPNMRFDLMSLLLGDILTVSTTDLIVIWAGGALAVALLCWIWRPLLVATISADLAATEGLNPDRARVSFAILMAGIIAIGMKIVGILLIVALLIIPAATARLFATTPEQMAVGAAVFGVVSVFGGLYASMQFDTPSGPSIVVIALALFIISSKINKKSS